MLSYLIKLHDVKHLEEGVTNYRVPTLMEVTIAPMAYRVVIVKQYDHTLAKLNSRELLHIVCD